MTKQQTACVQSYVTLLSALVSGRIEPEAFEATYLLRFKSEQTELPKEIFAVLDRLFGEVDAYCADPEVRGSDDIGNEELLASSRKALAELQKMFY